MADFTRFISYLYDYRGGERNRNLGFVKVEVRQGMSRLTVTLNHGHVLLQDMSLCGYITEDGAVRLIRLGTMEKGEKDHQWRFPLKPASLVSFLPGQERYPPEASKNIA